MSAAYHCDGPGCETWQRMPDRLPDEWLHVSEKGRGQIDCCSADCLIKFYAQREPLKTTTWGVTP